VIKFLVDHGFVGGNGPLHNQTITPVEPIETVIAFFDNL